jgi:hypothetical protein
MKKVYVWQLGYTTFKDFALHNNNVSCRPRGYVEVENVENSQDVRDHIWHLLNWGCWAEEKPKEVHSRLDHCNGDIVLKFEDEKLYHVCLPIGWTTAESFKLAINASKTADIAEFWPFPEVHKMSGQIKVVDDKPYIRENKDSEWIEITW